MPSLRTTHYEATVYYASTRSSSTQLYPFTQAQADEVGGVLEADGLNTNDALRLLEKWNRLGKRGDIRYTYQLPFEVRLALLDMRLCHG